MRAILTILLTTATLISAAAENPPVVVKDLTLEGEIEGENIVFTLQFDAEVYANGAELVLVAGETGYLDGELPRHTELLRRGDGYVLRFEKKNARWGGKASRQPVRFRFASRPAKEGAWRRTRFTIPMATTRKLAVICDRDDLDVQFPGALEVETVTTGGGGKVVTAYLGITDRYEVRWKPEIRKLDAELVVACEANTIATASVGALRLDTLLTYRVIQGALTELVLDLPEINVTQVKGPDIQDWQIREVPGHGNQLLVALSRPQEDTYRLLIEGELVLPEFPCTFDLPVIMPQEVIRTSGFLLMGTDSAIKLQVQKAGGLTQVDRAAVPLPSLDGKSKLTRAVPGRSTFAYQYANTPYTLALKADDIVTSLAADVRMVLQFEDNELVLDTSLELDIKDAAAREIVIETEADPLWTVTSVTGGQVYEPDVDIRDEGATRLITVPFKDSVSGVALVSIRMEKALRPDVASFRLPRIGVRDARSTRGYLVLAAEKGVRLDPEKVEGLREVHTGSAPIRVVGAQHAFRFKVPEWTVSVGVERTSGVVHSETFHLVSLGEGVLYGSAAITYHIGGAPLQEFTVRVPEEIATVEFTGADIEGWTREADLCKVRLQTRVMGDYTLLATFDTQFDPDRAVIASAGIETVDTESEVGYLAFASSASLRLTEAEALPESVFRIDRTEIPTAYSSPVADPILAAYKFVGTPHGVNVRVEPYPTEQLLGQVADFVELSTRLSRDGESVTTATYYVKNASRQYLIVILPEGADLWSIKALDEKGNTTDVLSQEADGRLLVPVPRPRDPNAAHRIQFVYANGHGKLGLRRGVVQRVGLRAPRLPESQATFTTWRVEVPQGSTIADSGGNMTPVHARSGGGLPAAFTTFRKLCGAVLDGPRGRRIVRVLRADWGGPRTAEFTRSVNLADAPAARLALRVVPLWVGRSSSVGFAATALVVGLLLLVPVLLGRRRLLWVPLAGSVWVLGLSQVSLGRVALAALAAVGLVCWLVYGFVRSATWLRHRRRRRRTAAIEAAVTCDELPPPFEPDTEPGLGGSARIALLLGLGVALATILAGPVLAKEVAEPGAPPPADIPVPFILSATAQADGPGTDRDAERSASVEMTLVFRAEEPLSFVVLPAAAVLKNAETGSADLELTAGGEGYVLNVKRRGRYRTTLAYRLPVTELDGVWRLELPLPASLQNRVQLRLPEPGLEIMADGSVWLRQAQHVAASEAEAIFGAGHGAVFTWKPRIRTVHLEKPVFFCEVNTLALLRSGVVDLSSLVHYQIAQGEVKEFRLLVPDDMNVTAVNAPGLATWSFDPDERRLDVIPEKPVSGDFRLTVAMQIPREGLPYAATVGALRVLGATRQRGSLALAGPLSVQVRMEDATGLNPMTVEDFSEGALAAALGSDKQGRAAVTVRRAYRYHRSEDVAVRIEADRVLPEIRVVETGTLSIADERIVLSTKLELAVAKAGIFSVALLIPEGFDVETLTGSHVSHWDDVETSPAVVPGDEPGAAARRVVVHFERQVLDHTDLNLVVARTEKGIAEKIDVPRIGVEGVRKHQGKLTVSGERGVRIMVDSQRGVDLKKSSEEGIMRAGVLAFDILRPTWSLVLRTEVQDALVKPEVLQWVDLAEGMLQGKAFLTYRIENAGTKTLFLRAPAPGVALTISGRQIARVHEVDSDPGLWQVDLHNKVERSFRMTASYQISLDPKQPTVQILPLRTVQTDPPRGYLVVTGGGRVQVRPQGDVTGLKVEDPRSIPAAFGAGDLSGAILCYRTVRPEYALALSVIRHDSADVLPATIDRVRMHSVVSSDGRLLTRMAMTMRVSDLRLLKMDLPNAGDQLWTVLVDGREVVTSRDGEHYCIPLEYGEGTTSVEMVFAGSPSSGLLARSRRYEAPRFQLPLNDIEWTLYVPPEMKYWNFGGTMQYVEGYMGAGQVFSAATYLAMNQGEREQSIQKAGQELNQGAQLAQAGRQNAARRAFENAYNYSQGQVALNEDARVQLNNLMKKQVKLGLVNRRAVLRLSQNILDAKEPESQEGFRDGEYTPEYAQRVEKGLSQKDNDALELVADKILEQQAAAAGVVTAIRVTLPAQGHSLRFTRALQRDPSGELSVSFSVSRGLTARLLADLWPAALIFGALWWALRRRLGGRATALASE